MYRCHRSLAGAEWTFPSNHYVSFVRSVGTSVVFRAVDRALKEVGARVNARAVDVEVSEEFAHVAGQWPWREDGTLRMAFEDISTTQKL